MLIHLPITIAKMNTAKIILEEDEFGLFTDKTSGKSTPVRRFTWRNKNRVTVQVITYGATITSIKVPDKNGAIDDIVMGFDDMKGKLFTPEIRSERNRSIWCVT
uniref:Galactose mutarotase n=1 Tax=Photinus pyralis TaxID=7054 RepID=A0A1Y1N4D3_PHOPY